MVNFVKEADNIKKEIDEGFMEDPRYKQCNKEALYGVILGLLNLVWWYAFGYGLGDRQLPHQVDEYVELDDLIETAKMYTLAALYYLND